jgi:virginiamycin B lyase
VSEYLGIDEPSGMAAGPDGALWFTNSGNNSIGRITTEGKVINYAVTRESQPLGIAAGPDGALWFTNRYNSIGRITTPAKISVTANSGAPGTAVDVSGNGFDPGDSITVKYKTGLSAPNPTTEVICTATAASDGSFTCSGDIPSGATAGASGSHKIVVKGEPSGAKTTTTFTIT